jgi:preprotein translocase subunit SecA
MRGLIAKIIGDVNKREIKKISSIITEINEWEERIASLSDDGLRNKTDEFKKRLNAGATVDEILPEAFAVVREAARRVLGMRHFDMQLLGGIVLHQGRIAEMKTGEGKTLVATLPAYLNTLTGRGVHIITVNDYLARRDSEWMGPVYRFLGLTVDVIIHGLDSLQRQQAYATDITYGTNNEFGFDYLRDNMVLYKKEMVQRELNYAIVDEVDSILIDEARTPLIISGQAEQATDDYEKFAAMVPRLKRDTDYTVDEKAHAVELTEAGQVRAEKLIEETYQVKNIFDNEADSAERVKHLITHLNQALKAHGLMKRDKDYVVKDGEVIIVDEFTGRLMFGRRYSDGLHQAIEAKEKVKVAKESMTLATITFQNYFRMYTKLAGMTGTAATEEEEFQKIYGMDVIVIPTNKPMIRYDLPDVVYKTERGKFRAVTEDIVQRHATGQPLLVGTISIEKSEELSRVLQKKGIRHEVLNAKHHEREAEIISQAGQCGAVTIATNMAGRGTDIVLGEGVTDLGGLHILGTERHEARRIDNQLRGRSGRQGDPGSSQFYISLEDDLMRLFGGDNIIGIMEKIGLEEDMPIDHPLISRAIETAQKRVEARNFDIRKHLLEYDNVINEQREVIYCQRRRVLEGENVREQVTGWFPEFVDTALSHYAGEKVYQDEWDLKALLQYAENLFLPPKKIQMKSLDGKSREELREFLLDTALEYYEEREKELGTEVMREVERSFLLRAVDRKWMFHIDAMDELRQGIGLRAYGQRDPLVEYKHEAYEMFNEMVASLKEDAIGDILFRKIMVVPQRQAVAVAHETPPSDGTAVHGPARSAKVGRNDPCPCGSGIKYKKCCGKKG